MNKYIIFIITALLAGCASIATKAPNKHHILQTEVKVTLIKDAKLPRLPNGMPQLARTTVGDGFCIIELTQYHRCLLHEIRHCFEGDWHKGRETTQDC